MTLNYSLNAAVVGVAPVAVEIAASVVVEGWLVGLNLVADGVRICFEHVAHVVYYDISNDLDTVFVCLLAK